jgi:hypothetical protein
MSASRTAISAGDTVLAATETDTALTAASHAEAGR